MKKVNPYSIVITTQYKKSYKRIAKRGYKTKLLDQIVFRLSIGDTLEPKYHDRALSGNYEGYRECHIQPDWLLIYKIENDVLILTLVDTGTHSDLFKK